MNWQFHYEGPFDGLAHAIDSANHQVAPAPKGLPPPIPAGLQAQFDAAMAVVRAEAAARDGKLIRVDAHGSESAEGNHPRTLAIDIQTREV